VRACVPGFFSYLQDNYLDQMKDMGIEKNLEQSQDVILPFVCSDSALRSHFEKHKDGWKRTNNIDKIKKLIIISNDHIYKHHKEIIPMTPYESHMIANAILRKSSYVDAMGKIEKKMNNKPINKSVKMLDDKRHE
jgi:ferritin-like metal-binding protein YciE